MRHKVAVVGTLYGLDGDSFTVISAKCPNLKKLLSGMGRRYALKIISVNS